jgi:hypothetical protein
MYHRHPASIIGSPPPRVKRYARRRSPLRRKLAALFDWLSSRMVRLDW